MTWLPTDETPLTDAARAYAEHGFRVLLVWGVRFVDGKPFCMCGKPHTKDEKSIGKHPVGAAWQKHASSNPDAVVAARRGKAKQNIGLEMGGDTRLVAIDIDGPEGRLSWSTIEGEHGSPAPATLASRTGRADGGEHRLYRVPAHLDMARLGNRSSFKFPGIDTRIEAGQIVVAPSMHASGQRYCWVERAEVAELPEWLFDALASPVEASSPRATPPATPTRTSTPSSTSPYLAKVLANACAKIASTTEGGRNALLFAKACTVFEYCVGENANHLHAWSELARAGEGCGLPEGEVRSVLTKAWDKAQKAPRSVKPSTRAAPPAPTSSPAVTDVSDVVRDDSWIAHLSTDNKGNIKNTLGNVCKLLRFDPVFRGRLTFNEMRLTACLDGKPLADHDFTAMRENIEQRWHFTPGSEVMIDAVGLVANENASHPVRGYLDALKWDGERRIDLVARDVLGIQDPGPIVLSMLRCFFVSSVARALEPGCKVDTSLVLVGDQGFKKSTFFSTLGGEWFSDSYADVRSKDGILAVHAAWIYEWGEIDRITAKNNSSDVKAFVVIARDFVRPPYGRGIVDVARSGVIVGSTNRTFLDDETGSRRFHPIPISNDVNIATLREWRDQLWAEAVDAFKNGEQWWLSKAEEDAREELAQEHTLENPWLEPIAMYLKSHSLEAMVGMSTADVLKHALHIELSAMGRGEEMRVAKAMKSLGWASVRERRAGAKVRVWLPKTDPRVTGAAQPAQPGFEVGPGTISQSYPGPTQPAQPFLPAHTGEKEAVGPVGPPAYQSPGEVFVGPRSVQVGPDTQPHATTNESLRTNSQNEVGQVGPGDRPDDDSFGAWLGRQGISHTPEGEEE